MSVDLRLATPSDLETVFALVRAFYRESAYPLDEAAARRALAELLGDATLGRVWIAARGDETLGYTALTFGFSIEHRGRDALVDELYVRPDARRRGVARALLDRLEAVCRETGVHALHLEVEGENPDAEALYRRRGFAGNARRLLTKRIAPFVALLLFAARAAFGWGPDGHRISGEIAWRNLTPPTKSAVHGLLPSGDFDTLAEAATWADTYARAHPREYRWLEPLHFMDADPHAKHVTAGIRCNCVIAAIEMQDYRLRDSAASPEAKVEALRLLAHFVGDVHQPLHVAHPDMRGGATIDVTFEGDPMTLHRLWDSELLERRLRDLRRTGGQRWQVYAQSLADSVTAEQRAQWTASLDPRTWADESLLLTQQPLFAVSDGASLGGDYYEKAMPVVEERLTQSGIRLAAMLNAIFDPGARLQ